MAQTLIFTLDHGDDKFDPLITNSIVSSQDTFTRQEVIAKFLLFLQASEYCFEARDIYEDLEQIFLERDFS